MCFWNRNLKIFLRIEEKIIRIIFVSIILWRYLPRNASTCPAIPLMAFRKIWGNAWRQGCWQGSTTFGLAIAYLKNACVCEITAGRHRSIGSPTVRKSRYQACDTASFVIVCGTSCESSSPVSIYISINYKF